MPWTKVCLSPSILQLLGICPCCSCTLKTLLSCQNSWRLTSNKQTPTHTHIHTGTAYLAESNCGVLRRGATWTLARLCCTAYCMHYTPETQKKNLVNKTTLRVLSSWVQIEIASYIVLYTCSIILWTETDRKKGRKGNECMYPPPILWISR